MLGGLVEQPTAPQPLLAAAAAAAAAAAPPPPAEEAAAAAAAAHARAERAGAVLAVTNGEPTLGARLELRAAGGCCRRVCALMPCTSFLPHRRQRRPGTVPPVSAGGRTPLQGWLKRRKGVSAALAGQRGLGRALGGACRHGPRTGGWEAFWRSLNGRSSGEGWVMNRRRGWEVAEAGCR